ncbi:MAG TPA: hypothetical protein VK837_12115, partial [Longimicrobiales bacterium]|nr:hypothetical protein [Longimicrobiales bacterium]
MRGRVPAALYAVGLALAAVYALTLVGGGPVPTALGAAAAVTGTALGFALARAGGPRWAAYASAFVGLQIATWAGGAVGTAGATACGAWGLALGLDAAAVRRAFIVAAAAALALLLAQALGLVQTALGLGILGGTGLCFAVGLALARGGPAPARASRTRQAAAPHEPALSRDAELRPVTAAPE